MSLGKEVMLQAWHRPLVVPLSHRAWPTVLDTLAHIGRNEFAAVPWPTLSLVSHALPDTHFWGLCTI